jgi:hypothetical protein
VANRHPPNGKLRRDASEEGVADGVARGDAKEGVVMEHALEEVDGIVREGGASRGEVGGRVWGGVSWEGG